MTEEDRRRKSELCKTCSASPQVKIKNAQNGRLRNPYDVKGGSHRPVRNAAGKNRTFYLTTDLLIRRNNLDNGRRRSHKRGAIIFGRKIGNRRKRSHFRGNGLPSFFGLNAVSDLQRWGKSRVDCSSYLSTNEPTVCPPLCSSDVSGDEICTLLKNLDGTLYLRRKVIDTFNQFHMEKTKIAPPRIHSSKNTLGQQKQIQAPVL